MTGQDVNYHDRTQRTLVMVGDSHGLVSGYDPADEFNVVLKLQAHQEAVAHVKQFPTLGLVTCGMDGKVVLSDLDYWTPFNTLVGHKRVRGSGICMCSQR